MTLSNGLILLVDDEEKILKRLGRALRDEGHDVVEGASEPLEYFFFVVYQENQSV